MHFTRELTALDDISQGRLLAGVGAGGTGFDSAVLGEPELTPRERVDRFSEFLALLTQLLENDRTDFTGTYYSAVNARSIPGPVQRPRLPLVVAANGPRALRLAAKYGDGWVTTGAHGLADEASWWRSVAEVSARFTEAAAGRSMDRYLNLDTSPVFSLSSTDAFADAVGRAAELGFTDVMAHWPRRSSWYAGDEKVLESVAPMLPKLRAS